MKKIVLPIICGLLLSHVAAQSAQAACSAGSPAGSVKVGSAISGGSVVVCASTSSAKTSTTTAKTGGTKNVVKKVAVSVRSVVVPCVIKVTSQAAVNDPRVPGCSYLVVAPAKPVVIAPKTVASIATSASVQNDQAAFTPNPVGISASPTIGQVGQAFFFTAVAGTHTRSGTILGKAAQVTFTPVSFEWGSDEGASGSGTSLVTNWSNEGAHSVSLTVGYSVAYSLGSGWVDAGVISSSASAAVQVVAASAPVVVKVPPPLLVSGNCKARPGSYGC